MNLDVYGLVPIKDCINSTKSEARWFATPLKTDFRLISSIFHLQFRPKTDCYILEVWTDLFHSRRKQ